MRTLTDEEAKLVEAGCKVAAVVEKFAGVCERDRRPPRETWEAYRAAGLKGLLVPKAQGGHALSAFAMAHISEAIGAADPATALTFIPQEYSMAAVARYASHPWHHEILQTLMAGERLTGFLLTEPQAGSDAAAIATHAEETADGWQLNGCKAWVSNAAHMD